jgi:hypothetical protein
MQVMMTSLTWGSQVQRGQSAEVLACEVTAPAVEKIYDLALPPADGNVHGCVTVLVRHGNQWDVSRPCPVGLVEQQPHDLQGGGVKDM